METGVIPHTDIPGPFDLQSTLESGQTFLWERRDGHTYETTAAYGGDAWYRTVHDGEVIEVHQTADGLKWRATTDATPILRERLRLDDDLPAIMTTAPNNDPLLDAAYDAYEGMRVVKDPFFGCLISFICSAQMRVERIFAMQQSLREAYGREINFDGTTVHTYPTPEALAAATEDDLRDLSLGYRAPYVRRTANLVASGEHTHEDVAGLDYEDARDALTGFVGVGDKVADCVALFSLGHLEAVPLDTWIRSAIEEHYPDCAHDDYAATSRAIRERFGPYAGYPQTYVFHYLRSGEN